MNVTIKINCDNAAFQDGQLYTELSRILSALALNLRFIESVEELHLLDNPIYDFNGNKVGQLSFKK